jgi:protein-tyrosine phosphatase
MPGFKAFLRFVDREIAEREVLIHCNQGESRAPSLALLYLAKRLGSLPNESYDLAAESFEAQFPYRPGQGISRWLTRNWRQIT